MVGPYIFKSLKEENFWVPVCVEYVPCYLLYPASSAVMIPCYIVGVKGRRNYVNLENARTCGRMVDVLIGVRDWFFSQSGGT